MEQQGSTVCALLFISRRITTQVKLPIPPPTQVSINSDNFQCYSVNYSATSETNIKILPIISNYWHDYFPRGIAWKKAVIGGSIATDANPSIVYARLMGNPLKIVSGRVATPPHLGTLA